MPWYTVTEEERLLLDCFIMESTNSCGYSLSIRSCLMVLISLLKSLLSWHMNLAWLIKHCVLNKNRTVVNVQKHNSCNIRIVGRVVSFRSVWYQGNQAIKSYQNFVFRPSLMLSSYISYIYLLFLWKPHPQPILRLTSIRATTYNTSNFLYDEHDKLKIKERKIYAFFLSTRANTKCKSFEIIERKSNKLGNVCMALNSRAFSPLLSLISE
jgi:hypothetical protein